MSNGNVTPCEYARDRHRNLVTWRNLWTILLFAFGAAVVIFLVLAVIFFLRQDWLVGALTTLGTIVEGAGIAWVSKRRIDAVKEEEKAYKDVGEKCQDTSTADGLRNSMKLLGRFL